MKKAVILLHILFSKFAFRQNDFATINVYRESVFTIGHSKVEVLINDAFVCDLNNGGQLEYKVFNPLEFNIEKSKNTKITITDGSSWEVSKLITLEKGKSYYLLVEARLPRSFGFKFKQLESPVGKGKLKKSEFISMADIGKVENHEIHKPDTDWTKDKLLEYWKNNEISDLEGIYEKFGIELKYEVAVLKENNEYKMIYLSGAKGTSWVTGDIKSKLEKTATFGIFKSKWFMLNKSESRDVFITFDNGKFTTLSEVDKSIDSYIKTYPAYDYNK